MAQVTISTIHAAKGLEWPVVFIPAAYQGSIPHSRAEDSNEERRLLYVAMTRAKALLYMSYPAKNSQGEDLKLSPFLEPPSLAPFLEDTGPSLGSSTVQSISQILRRSLPSAKSISKSSAYLRSFEDDLFPKGDEDEAKKKDSDWRSESGRLSYTRGQRLPERQRIELGRSNSMAEAGSRTSGGSMYPTTMERAATFTLTTMKPAFISAGSHLQALGEKSANGAIQENEVNPQNSLKPKGVSKKPSKGMDGQRTLSHFLGQPEPTTRKRPAPDSDFQQRKVVKTSSQAFGMGRNLNVSRPNTSNEPLGIAPALANHRLGFKPSGIRPKQPVHPEPLARNDYVFLSSSPPRAKLPVLQAEKSPEPPLGLPAKPAILSLIRPATSMHTTTVSVTQNSLGSKRTLGVKRSMNEWSSGNGQAFRPPTMKGPR